VRSEPLGAQIVRIGPGRPGPIQYGTTIPSWWGSGCREAPSSWGRGWAHAIVFDGVGLGEDMCGYR
jgi:hypothetical protein